MTLPFRMSLSKGTPTLTPVIEQALSLLGSAFCFGRPLAGGASFSSAGKGPAGFSAATRTREATALEENAT